MTTFVDIRNWKKTNETIEYENEKATIYYVGELDCEGFELDPIPMFIRDSIYKKLITGECVVDKESYLKNEIIIRDKNGTYIKPLNRDIY